MALRERKEYSLNYYYKNKDKISQQRKHSWKKNKINLLSKEKAKRDKQRKERGFTKDSARRRKKFQEVKIEVILNMGGKCVCCGEMNTDFLTIDHIDGGGAKHRKEFKSSSWFFMRQYCYPKGYQLLCFNCNFSKYIGGRCIHKRERNMVKEITSFEGEYWWLNNDCACWVKSADGIEFPSLTNCFNYEMFIGEWKTLKECRDAIIKCTNPRSAKSVRKKFAERIPNDWQERKIDVMKRLINQKFQKGTMWSIMLRDTGDAILRDDSKADHFNISGEMLGRLIMEKRRENAED